MSRRFRVALCAAVGALAVTITAVPIGATASATASATAGASSDASTGAARVPAGGRSVTQYGVVVFVADGDTIDVKIDGVAADPGRRGTRIRFLATQAMELHEYRHDLARVTGECHAVEAARRLKALLSTAAGDGRRVRLTARSAASSSLGRDARFVAIKGSDGAWHDVGTVMVREGHVIPSYQRVEYAHNRSYRALAQAAAARGVGLWDTDFCGQGPAADLSVRVRWDADGDDGKNVNGEYVKITNRGRSTVNLGGWWVRDSATRPGADRVASRRGYILPREATVAPGASLVVHVGRRPATPAPRRFYYGRSSPIFENATPGPSALGDGAYLFDPQGDLREWHQYPCVSSRARACTT